LKDEKIDTDGNFDSPNLWLASRYGELIRDKEGTLWRLVLIYYIKPGSYENFSDPPKDLELNSSGKNDRI
jgi:hypothetical protein